MAVKDFQHALQRNELAINVSSSKPWISLIDMNSYFATLEQQANPHLRGKPVVIVKELGRTCVIAASKEAKSAGITTGCNLKHAKIKSSRLYVIPANFSRYFAATQVLKQVFQQLSPEVEVFSLDEAFINLTHCRQLYPTAKLFFHQVKKAISQQLGEWVTFSLGFGGNRLQAKLASEFAGKDNYFEINQDNLTDCLLNAKIDEVCGIGASLGRKLKLLGVNHPHQINLLDQETLLQHFGPFWSYELLQIAQGKDSHVLRLIDRSLPHMKSVGRSKTLFRVDARREFISQLIINLSEEIGAKTRKMGLTGQRLDLFLVDGDHQFWHGKLHCQLPICDNDELNRMFIEIYQQQIPDHPAIIRLGLRLGKLQPIGQPAECWLPERQQRRRVAAAVDALNQKYGLFVVKPASLLGFEPIRPEVTGYLGDKKYQFMATSSNLESTQSLSEKSH